ncbi:MAG: hypothetical protein J0L97_10530 [Alphaproteobacteria bacterium]|nr:hypothetical protein [Alphaproteobacteria bacterium]
MYIPTLGELAAWVEQHRLRDSISADHTFSQCGVYSKQLRDNLLERGIPALFVKGEAGDHMFCLVVCQEGVAVLDLTASQFLEIGSNYLLGQVDAVTVYIANNHPAEAYCWQQPWKVKDVPFVDIAGSDLSPLEQYCFDRCAAEGVVVERSNTLEEFIESLHTALEDARCRTFRPNVLLGEVYDAAVAAVENGLLPDSALEGMKRHGGGGRGIGV